MSRKPAAILLHFPADHFIDNVQRPLTYAMIKSLRLACAYQRHKISFGPTDIRGSVMSLVRRGLVRVKTETIPHDQQSSWYVTDEAMEMLREAGIHV